MTDKWGIVLGHGYTISRVIQLRDGTRLVRARNPWGKDSYMGEYGSESPQAQDPNVIAQIPDIGDDSDGYIYVPLAQFKVSFAFITVNYNPKKMKMDYYLKLEGEDKRHGSQNLDKFMYTRGDMRNRERKLDDDSFNTLEQYENRQSEWKK